MSYNTREYTYNFNKGLATKKQLDEFYKMARNLKTEVKRGRPEYIGKTKVTWDDIGGSFPRGRRPDPEKAQLSSAGFVRPRMGITQVGEGFKLLPHHPEIFGKDAIRLKVEPKRGIDKPISGWAKMNVAQKQKAIIDYYVSIAQKGGTGRIFLNPILDPYRENTGIFKPRAANEPDSDEEDYRFEADTPKKKAASPIVVPAVTPATGSIADLLAKRAQPTSPKERVIPQKYKRVRGRKDFDESIKSQFPKAKPPPIRNNTKPPPIKKTAPPPIPPKISKPTPPPITKAVPPTKIRKKTLIIKKKKPEPAAGSSPKKPKEETFGVKGGYQRSTSGEGPIGPRPDGTKGGYTATNVITLFQKRENISKIPKEKKAEMKQLIDGVLRKRDSKMSVNKAIAEIKKLYYNK
jgi:hypothetical protein